MADLQRIIGLLRRGKNYAEIGRATGISRERVRQIVEAHGLQSLRFPCPDGLIPIKQLALDMDMSGHTIHRNIDDGLLKAVYFHGRWYADSRIRHLCPVCRKEVSSIAFTYCPDCGKERKIKAKNRTHWRHFYSRKGRLPLPSQLPIKKMKKLFNIPLRLRSPQQDSGQTGLAP